MVYFIIFETTGWKGLKMQYSQLNM